MAALTLSSPLSFAGSYAQIKLEPEWLTNAARLFSQPNNTQSSRYYDYSSDQQDRWERARLTKGQAQCYQCGGFGHTNTECRSNSSLLIAQVQIKIGLIRAIAITTAATEIDVIIAMTTNDEIIKGAMTREIVTGTLTETTTVEETIENKIIREETVPVLKISTEMVNNTTILTPAIAD